MNRDADTDIKTRNELIVRYSPLVKRVAHRIAQRLPQFLDIDDLISAGIIGLIDAIDRYDRNKSKNFNKYAEIRIRGAILDDLRCLNVLSRAMSRKGRNLKQITARLECELGRAPTDEEVARQMGINLSVYLELLNQLRPGLVVSFEDLGLISEADQRAFVEQLHDQDAMDPAARAHFNQMRSLIASLIEQLPEQQRIVLNLYYFEDLSLREIGEVLELSESRVSQIHTRAVRHLRLKLRRTLKLS